jgi:DNA-binding transcriptional MerR regulator
MDYTVHKLAQLSGVSIRTLHFYDEIGLLKPAYVAENGYRYYQEKQLLVLQQILFFRELGFELKQIQEILGQSDFDRLKALESQKTLLQNKITQLQTLLKTIDKTVNHLEGKRMLPNKDIFKGFAPDSEKQKKYEEFVEEYLTHKYGHKKAQEAMAHTHNNVKTWTTKDWENVSIQFDEICKALVEMLEKKLNPDAKEVQNIIRKHYEVIKKFWEPTKERYAGHADFIMETDLRKFYDKYHPKLAQFISDAIKLFAERNL